MADNVVDLLECQFSRLWINDNMFTDKSIAEETAEGEPPKKRLAVETSKQQHKTNLRRQ